MDALTKRKAQIDAAARAETLRMVRNALANGFNRRSPELLPRAEVQNNIEDAAEFNVIVPGAHGGTFKVRITRYRDS